MVKVIETQGKKLYECDECGFRYEKKEWAEKCEAWCKEHQSCNLEIYPNAIGLRNVFGYIPTALGENESVDD